MDRALLGYATNPNQQILVTEVARLRARVRELEAELAELRSNAADMDLELHRITEQGSAVLA